MRAMSLQRLLLIFALVAIGCGKKPVAAVVRPPNAEFLLAAGDSTYWVRSGPDGLHVRSAPMLVTQTDGHFYEVFISDDVHDYEEASFASARAYSRDIMKSDSLLVFADARVPTETKEWQRGHPQAIPLDPSSDDTNNPPPTIVSDDIEVVDVHGPWMSYSYALDVDVAGRTSHDHFKRRGVLDIRSGAAASLQTLFGAAEATRLQARARTALTNLQDSVRHTTDARGEIARRTLGSFTFDSMSFAVTDESKQPAVAYLVSGTGVNGEALSLFLPPIATAAPSWWTPVRATLPEWNADSSLMRWARTDYEITAQPSPNSDTFTIALTSKTKDGIMHTWPVATVSSPAYQQIALDATPIDSSTRAALSQAFDQSRSLGRLSHQANWMHAQPFTHLHAATLRACPSPLRPGATRTRRYASRNFVATSSACLH